MAKRSRLTRMLVRTAAAVVPFITVAVATGAAEAANCGQPCHSDRRLKRDIRPI